MYVWLRRIQELQFPSLGAHCDCEFLLQNMFLLPACLHQLLQHKDS